MHKIAQKVECKLRAKFQRLTRSYIMVKIACLDDAFSEFVKLEASPEEVQSLQQKEKKRRKKERQKRKQWNREA